MSARYLVCVFLISASLAAGASVSPARGHGHYARSYFRSYFGASHSRSTYRYRESHPRSMYHYHASFSPSTYHRSNFRRSTLWSKFSRRKTYGPREHRSTKAKHDFEVMTGHPHGWAGHVVDHIIPLACGGADAPSNMQWQTIAEGKAKDKWERKGCVSRSRHR